MELVAAAGQQRRSSLLPRCCIMRRSIMRRKPHWPERAMLAILSLPKLATAFRQCVPTRVTLAGPRRYISIRGPWPTSSHNNNTIPQTPARQRVDSAYPSDAWPSRGRCPLGDAPQRRPQHQPEPAATSAKPFSSHQLSIGHGAVSATDHPVWAHEQD